MASCDADQHNKTSILIADLQKLQRSIQSLTPTSTLDSRLVEGLVTRSIAELSDMAYWIGRHDEHRREHYRELQRARDLGPLGIYVDGFIQDLESLLAQGHPHDHELAGLDEQLSSIGPAGRVLVRMIIQLARDTARPPISASQAAEFGALYPDTLPSAPTGWRWHLLDATALHPMGRETLLLQLREVPPALGMIAYDHSLVLGVSGKPDDAIVELVREANRNVVIELERLRAQDRVDA